MVRVFDSEPNIHKLFVNSAIARHDSDLPFSLQSGRLIISISSYQIDKPASPSRGQVRQYWRLSGASRWHHL